MIMQNEELRIKNKNQNQNQNQIVGATAPGRPRLGVGFSCVIVICAVLMSSIFANVFADQVRTLNKKGNALYGKGDYEGALKFYEDALAIDSTDSKLKMNKGSALFRMEKLEEAEQAYTDALAAPPREKKSLADAYYNLGNIQYKQAEQLQRQQNLKEAQGKYQQALDNYINTLKLRSDDKDAKWNLQLAHQNIRLLEQQQQEQEQNQDDQCDNKDDKQDQNKQDKNDKNDKDNKDDKDQGKDDKQDDKDQKNDEQQQQQQQEQDEQDMKREEAERLIEQFADDADSLNKPIFQRGRVIQPEKDW